MGIPFVPVAPGLCNLAPTIGYAGALRFLFPDGTDLSGIDTVEAYDTSGDPEGLGVATGSVTVDGTDYEHLTVSWTAEQSTGWADSDELRWRASDAESVPWLAGRVYPTVEGDGGAGDGTTDTIVLPGETGTQIVYVQGVGPAGADGADGADGVDGEDGAPGDGSGDVVGPDGATAGNLAALDATGKILSDSGVAAAAVALTLGRVYGGLWSDDPTMIGGSYSSGSDSWTIAAYSGVVPADYPLYVTIGDDPSDSASGSGLFLHDGSGEFTRLSEVEVADTPFVYVSTSGEMLVTGTDGLGFVTFDVHLPADDIAVPVTDVLAGYGIDVSDSSGEFTVAQRKVRTIPTVTAGYWNGGGSTTPLAEARGGDPAGVRLPAGGVTEIDGVTLNGPRVCAVGNTPDSDDQGFWEVFLVAANGADNGYFEVDDFADPKPSEGDIYFHRTVELNSIWVEDSLYGGTPVYVPVGDVHADTIIWTLGDGLSCNFRDSKPVYTPETPGDWPEGAPSKVAAALDTLAARGGGGGGVPVGDIVWVPIWMDPDEESGWTVQQLNSLIYASLGTIDGDGTYVGWDVGLTAGTWEMGLTQFVNTNGGIVVPSIDGDDLASLDQYAGSSGQSTVTYSGIVVATDGAKRVKFTVDGKNASSTDYRGRFSAVWFRRTA